MFPHISAPHTFIPFVSNKPEIRIKKEEPGFTIITYMINTPELFTGVNELYEKECRGLVFDENQIICRPLHKFFNIGEHQSLEQIDFSNIESVMTKFDGSMVTPFLFNNKIYWKTKKSYQTPEANACRLFCEEKESRIKLVRHLLENGLTPIFEMTSNLFPIVVNYPKTNVTILHIRDNISGEYYSRNKIKQLIAEFNADFDYAEDIQDHFKENGVISKDKIKQMALTTTGIEGWVFQFKNGEMLKQKTDWYIKLHHAVTFIRWRDIAEAVCNDSADDLKSNFVMVGRSIACIEKVEKDISDFIHNLQKRIKEKFEENKNLIRKDFAIKFKQDQDFGFLMDMYAGKEIDFYQWYSKLWLKEHWGLEVVASNSE